MNAALVTKAGELLAVTLAAPLFGYLFAVRVTVTRL